ncbi:hypothetical protein AGMMS49938_11570 [Fibrobacterales bacterium]|nr:hypothetical protein AGMMS49938_11570 [Fibrobacterales bacterium]
MKACVLESIGNLVYREVEEPQVRDGEVLLEIGACGICSSDIDRVFKTGTYHFPLIPGHEIAGRVVQTGENAAVFPLIPCRKCEPCKNGDYALCENYDYFGSRRNGGFAEYLAVPSWNLVPIDKSVSFECACLCEPAAVALHSVRRSEVKISDSALVVGTGTIGFLVAEWLHLQGVKQITILGRSDRKLEFARSLGFAETCRYTNMDSLQKNRASVVFECVGSPESVEIAVRSAGKHGRVVLVGNPNGDIKLLRDSYWQILRKELSIQGVWNSNFSEKQNDWKTVVAALEQKKLNIAPLITHRFSLSECGRAFETLRDRSVFSVKAVFTNGIW